MTKRTANRPRVFISYAQQDEAPGARALALANALRRDGILAELDQYHQQEQIHWARWCLDQLQPAQSDWVLMVCTRAYRARIEDPQGVGLTLCRGVYWEGAAIINAVYTDKGNARFIPVLLDDTPEEAIPAVVEGYTRFRLRGLGLASGDPGYEGLYRLLTRQPGVVPPVPGEPVDLPPWGEPAPGPVAAAPGAAAAPSGLIGPHRAVSQRRPVWVLAALVLALILGVGAFWWFGQPDPVLTQQLKIGDAFMDTGRPAEALAAYRTALDLDRRDERARFGVAKAAVLADPPPDLDQESAERRLQTLRADHPRDPHLPLLLGLLAQNRGDAGAARARYDEAIALDPDLPQAWFGRGVLADARGDRGEARGAYERALVRAPGQRQYLANLAGVLLAQGDFAAALDRYEDLLESAPGLLLARIDAGNAARLAGDLTAACWHHDRLLKALDEDGAFAGPDNGGEWLFDTDDGEVALQTPASKRAYGRATANLTRWLAGAPPCAGPAAEPVAPAGDGRDRAVLAQDLRRLEQVRPQWRERLAAFRQRMGP
ncbi:MAG TPA: tetratricopeptide repeat protein [Lamprocystis sp. (in: g-proteobacteria)]|nr:tetratricopeptide repeat protein [Lamprocystis sp. (in: g-proteobacteria)]